MGANAIDAGGLLIEKKRIFAYSFTICWYAPAEQPPPKMAEANNVVTNNKSGK